MNVKQYARPVTEIWWLSTRAMTVCVDVDPAGYIIAAPPILRGFVEKPFRNLVKWMTRQGGLRVERLGQVKAKP